MGYCCGGMARGARGTGRGAVFGESFPWGWEWSACRRCGRVHVASSVGRNSGPGLLYHSYCVITSPKMGKAEGYVWPEHGKVKGLEDLLR
jgi:hypothetical protein